MCILVINLKARKMPASSLAHGSQDFVVRNYYTLYTSKCDVMLIVSL